MYYGPGITIISYTLHGEKRRSVYDSGGNVKVVVESLKNQGAKDISIQETK